MQLSGSQIKNLLTTIGVGFVVHYVDEASSGMSDTQKQADKLKGSITDVGTATDDTSRKMSTFAKMGDAFTGTIQKVQTLAATFNSISNSMTNMFAPHIQGAIDLQTQIKQTQSEMMKLNGATYNQLSSLAFKSALQYGANASDAATAQYYLAANVKGMDGLKAIMPQVGLNKMLSGGQFDMYGASKNLMGGIEALFPTVNRDDPAAYALAAKRVVGLNLKMNQNSPLRYDQLETLYSTLSAPMLTLDSMHDKTAVTDMMALAATGAATHSGNPAWVGMIAGRAAGIYSQAKALGQIGINVTNADGTPRALDQVLYGKHSFLNSPIAYGIESGQIGLRDPRYLEMQQFLGGQWGGLAGSRDSTFRSRLQANEKAFSGVMADPSKNVDENAAFYRKGIKFQGDLLSGETSVISTKVGTTFLDATAKALMVINPLLQKFIAMFLNDSNLAKISSILDILSTTVTSIAAGFVKFGMAAASGIFNTFMQWEKTVNSPVQKFITMFQVADELLMHSNMLSPEVWKKAQHEGIGGFVDQLHTTFFKLGNLMQGVGQGFNSVFQPFLAAMSKDKSDVATNLLDTITNFFKEMNVHDFSSIGQKIGAGFANGVVFVSKFFGAIINGFNFLRDHPMASVLLGNAIGGPVGTALQAMGAYQQSKKDDPLGNAGLTSMISDPRVKLFSTGGNATRNLTGNGNIGTHILGAVEGVSTFFQGLGLLGTHGASAGPSASPGGLGLNLGISAQNVYVNGQNVMGGGGGMPGASGSSEGGGIGGFLQKAFDLFAIPTAIGGLLFHYGRQTGKPGVQNFGQMLENRFAPESIIVKAGLWVFNAVKNIFGSSSGTGSSGIFGAFGKVLGGLLRFAGVIGVAVDAFQFGKQLLGDQTTQHNLQSAWHAFTGIPAWLTQRSNGGPGVNSMMKTAAAKFGIDPRLIYAEYGAETSFGKNNPRGDAYSSMGLISGPGHYRGYGYHDSGANTMQEAYNVNASMWADSIKEMKAKGIPLTPGNIISYHEGSYTPIGAANDPGGLNANKIRNTMAYYNGASISAHLDRATLHTSSTPNRYNQVGTQMQAGPTIIRLEMDGKKMAEAMHPHAKKLHAKDKAHQSGNRVSQVSSYLSGANA